MLRAEPWGQDSDDIVEAEQHIGLWLILAQSLGARVRCEVEPVRVVSPSLCVSLSVTPSTIRAPRMRAYGAWRGPRRRGRGRAEVTSARRDHAPGAAPPRRAAAETRTPFISSSAMVWFLITATGSRFRPSHPAKPATLLVISGISICDPHSRHLGRQREPAPRGDARSDSGLEAEAPRRTNVIDGHALSFYALFSCTSTCACASGPLEPPPSMGV